MKKIIPAIDLYNNNVVRLTQGDFENSTTYSMEPLKILKKFLQKGVSNVHIIDLNGAKKGSIENSINFYGSVYVPKEAWNDRGNILFGSANVDRWALQSNFECDLQIHDPYLAQRLQQALALDLCHCRQQRTSALRQQFLPNQ